MSQEIREDRLYRILTRFYFCDFRGKEFFNSHACLQQLLSYDVATVNVLADNEGERS